MGEVVQFPGNFKHQRYADAVADALESMRTIEQNSVYLDSKRLQVCIDFLYKLSRYDVDYPHAEATLLLWQLKRMKDEIETDT